MKTLTILFSGLLGVSAYFYISHQNLVDEMEEHTRDYLVAEPSTASLGYQNRELAKTPATVDALDNTPEPCGSFKKLLLKMDSQGAKEAFVDHRLDMDDRCLEQLDLDADCLVERDSEYCLRNWTIARAKILGSDDNSDDIERLSHKLIYSFLDPSLHENAAELFQISTELVDLRPNHAEIHVIHSFSGILALSKGQWDDDIYRSVMSSIAFLETTEEEGPRAEILKIYFYLMNYNHHRDIPSLEQAREKILEFMNRWPDNPQGYYMWAQILGLDGRKDLVIKAIQKGLSLGEHHPRYYDYQMILEQLLDGPMTMELLTFRFPENFFHLESLAI